MVLQTVDPGFTFFDITFERLRFRQLDLFLLNHLIILAVQGLQFSFQLGPRSSVLFNGNLTLKLDNLGIHRQNISTKRFKPADGFFTLDQCAGKVFVNADLLFVQRGQLALQ